VSPLARHHPEGSGLPIRQRQGPDEQLYRFVVGPLLDAALEVAYGTD
jgi:hypothetical protein